MKTGMRLPMLWTCLPAFLSFAFLLSAHADATVPPGVRVQSTATPRKALIGDPIEIVIDISLPAHSRVEFPPAGDTIGDFALLEWAPGTVDESDRPHQRARIVAAVYKTGTFTFPSLKVQLIAADGSAASWNLPSLDIEILSVLTGERLQLKDLKKQVDLPEPPRRTVWIWMAAALLVALLLAVVFFLWRRRRPRPIAPKREAATPDSLACAEAELRSLLSGGLPPPGGERSFYIRLSEILRKILEAALDLHAEKQTTAEILSGLDKQTLLPPEELNAIASFLHRCDLVKFAKMAPSPAEQQSDAADARKILEIARRHRSAGQRHEIAGTDPSRTHHPLNP